MSTAPETQTSQADLELMKKAHQARDLILSELRKVIIAQEEMIDQILILLFAGGHGLITGVPGLAKTLTVKTLARALGLSFNRIQFTPDLMPSDITGMDIMEEDRASGHRRMTFIKGPIFSSILLADEINRTPPKTQAALLEAMQEHQVTAAGKTYSLPSPFVVLATQNPIEMEGTYPLPEAQLDRFMFNIRVGYLNEDDEVRVVMETTGEEMPHPSHVLSADDVTGIQRIVRSMPAADYVVRYAVRLVAASRPDSKTAPDFVNKWVSYGASLRASQYLVLGGKVRALFDGRLNVGTRDIRALAGPVLRHRILTNFHAEAEKVSSDDIVKQLLEQVKRPSSGL
jgi:MoxR-like ATPase